MSAADFYYDFSSPYAYLAAHRVDDVLPVPVTWRPIAFGPLLRQTGRIPWSFNPDREVGMRECEARAVARGLPPLRWPEGWPRESYSLTPLRAALVAERAGRLREMSLALYDQVFVHGRQLGELDHVLEAARAAGVDEDAVRAGVADQAVKDDLRARTDAALASGVVGIPTVAVAGELFWGDDRLEDAAQRAA